MVIFRHTVLLQVLNYFLYVVTICWYQDYFTLYGSAPYGFIKGTAQLSIPQCDATSEAAPVEDEEGIPLQLSKKEL